MLLILCDLETLVLCTPFNFRELVLDFALSDFKEVDELFSVAVPAVSDLAGLVLVVLDLELVPGTDGKILLEVRSLVRFK